MADRFSSGPAFTSHVPCHPFSTDPSQTLKTVGQPAPIRETVTQSWVNRGNGSGLIGRMAGASSAAVADIVVTQANGTPGTHVIKVGIYELRPAVDFLVGANDIALAANLAAAIDALSGYAGTTDGVDTVSVDTTTAHGDDHVMEGVGWGAASAFALAALDRPGFMDRGAPAPVAPLLT